MKQELMALLGWVRAWMRRAPGEARIDHALRLTTAAVVVLFPAACTLVDRSDSVSLLLLLVVGIVAWVRNGFKTGLTRRDWLCVAAFASFFVAGLVAFELGHQTDSGFRLLGRYLRLLFLLPALMALKRYRPPALLVWAGLGAGALAFGLDAIWERFHSGGFLRPNGDLSLAILFGDLATLTVFTFAAGYALIDGRLPKLGPWLVGACVVAGILACLLSGTRGAWLALPVLLVLFLTAGHLLRPRTLGIGIGIVVVLFAAVYLLPESHMRERIGEGVAEGRAYFHLQPSIQSLGPPPVCMDDPELLQAWAASAKVEAGVPDLRVQTANAASLPDLGCTHATVLHVINHGDEDLKLRFPRMLRHDHKPVRTAWIVFGKGSLVYGSGRHPRQFKITRNPRYQRVDIHLAHHFGDGVNLIVPAHADARVLPLEQEYGEYRYAPLQHSSISERLQMWAAAWSMFLEHPAFGVGTGAYMAEAEARVEANAGPPVIAVYDHPHSEYLDALSSRGILGFLAELLLLGVPGWLFLRGLGTSDPVRTGASLAGLLMTVGFALFGLTETMFIHSVTLGWYAIMTAIFMATAEQGT